MLQADLGAQVAGSPSDELFKGGFYFIYIIVYGSFKFGMKEIPNVQDFV